MDALDPITLQDGVTNTVTLDPLTLGVLIANESPMALKIALPGKTFWLPAWTIDFIDLQSQQTLSGIFKFTPKNISSSTSAPSSVALLTLYQAGDKLTGQYPTPLTRQTNLGNGVITTAGSSTLVNDGSAANTTIIETTPTGQSTSAFVLDNMGNATWRTLDNNVWAVVISIIQNATGVATKLFHGIADSANAVAATGVTSGALSAAVTVAPNAIRSGAINAGATVSGAQVTTAVANASAVPASGVTAGTLASGVDLTTITSDAALITSDGSGNLTENALIATGFKNNGVGNYGIVSKYAASLDNGALATDGSGNVNKIGNIVGAGSISCAAITPQNGQTLHGISTFSGAASGTYTHGLNITPLAVSALQKVAGSTDTYGSDSFGTTTVHINVNASPQAFTAICVA